MSVSVVIPYSPSSYDRGLLRDYVAAWWKNRLPDADIVVSDDGQPTVTAATFNRPRAINRGVAISSGDVVIVADADTIHGENLDARLRAAENGVVTFPSSYVRIGQTGTNRVLDGGVPSEYPVEVATAFSWSGVVVCPRAALDATLGFDERFEGWSSDDIAFAMAVNALWGADRWARFGTVYHLHHERDIAETYGRPGFEDARALTDRYLLHATDREGMLSIVRAGLLARGPDAHAYVEPTR